MPRRDLIPRPNGQPAPVHDRRLNAAIAEAEQPGLESAARLNAAAFAASVGLHRAAMLSQAADRAFAVSPMGENVYRDILNAYGAVAVSEIQRLGFHGGGQS